MDLSPVVFGTLQPSSGVDLQHVAIVGAAFLAGMVVQSLLQPSPIAQEQQSKAVEEKKERRWEVTEWLPKVNLVFNMNRPYFSRPHFDPFWGFGFGYRTPFFI